MDYDYKEAMKLENQLCFPLYAAARQVTGIYTPYLKPLNLTYTQYVVFLVRWEQDGITVGDLGARLLLDNGTLSPLLKKLEHAGYIERRRERDDERVVVIYLTDEGRELQKKAKDIPLNVGACVRLDYKKAKELHALLYELIQNVEKSTAV